MVAERARRAATRYVPAEREQLSSEPSERENESSFQRMLFDPSAEHGKNGAASGESEEEDSLALVGEVAGGAGVALGRLVRREQAGGVKGGKERSGQNVATPLPADAEPLAREPHVPDPSAGGAGSSGGCTAGSSPPGSRTRPRVQWRRRCPVGGASLGVDGRWCPSVFPASAGTLASAPVPPEPSEGEERAAGARDPADGGVGEPHPPDDTDL